MIVEYFRPKDIAEALELLDKTDIKMVLMGGGTALDRYSPEAMTVIDLQDLDLGGIQKKGNLLEIGATVTLQSLLDETAVSEVLKNVIRREATHNLRQVATVAGTLLASDGRSPFTTAMLALDTSLTLLPGDSTINLGDLLLKRGMGMHNKLISKISLPINVKLAYEDVSRSPADLPIVSAAVAIWPGGRTRVTLGGYGEMPTLAADGPDMGGEEFAARDAYLQAGDEWASAEYRMDVASTLIKRCFSELEV